jgi:predicted house-cleaning noncanonical NTP pyrophosphatase (MazG superfamily)
MMAYGNEPGGRNQVPYLSGLVDYWQKKDSRRVYTGGAGWPYVENADYWNPPDPRIQAWGGELRSIINAQPPRTDYDYSAIIRKNMPTVSHEIGQWCVYPNLNEIEKYTGVLKAKNFEIFKETLAEKHMGDLADQFLYASGRLQTLCYKADIEAALRTPGFAGFQLLDLHDFPGQGTALVGVVDAFWDTKGYVDGKEFSRFCNSVVPLVRFPKMVWLNNEKMDVPVEIANFGEKPFHNAPITWSITTSDGQLLKKGSFTHHLPLDNCIQVGTIEFALNEIKKPEQLTVSVAIESLSAGNQWNIWVYPAQKPAIQNIPYITSTFDQTAIEKLNKGESVLLTFPRGTVSPQKGGNIPVGFSSIFWNTAWTRKQAPHTLGILCDPKHPALSSFPNEGYSDYQWWDIVSNCDAMLMDDFPPDFRPIIHLIDDWFTNRKLGILFEAKAGNGKIMICSVDLQNGLDKRTAAAQFRQSLLEYMSSARFNPEKEVNIDLIKGLLNNNL